MNKKKSSQGINKKIKEGRENKQENLQLVPKLANWPIKHVKF